jgi:hypothetical protein
VIHSPSQFAYRALNPELAIEDYPWLEHLVERREACWLCGALHDRHVPKARAINSDFTNHGWAKSPHSDLVCLPCVLFLKASPMGMHYWRNKGHWFTAGRHIEVQRDEWRTLLAQPHEPPYLATVPVSGQKHLIFRAPVVYGQNAAVQFEEMQIWYDPREFAELLARFEDLYNAGLRKEEIVSGRPAPNRITKIGTLRWREMDSRIEPHRGKRLLLLVAHCARRQEREEETDVRLFD